MNYEQVTNIITRVEKEPRKWPTKGWEYVQPVGVITTEIRKEKQRARWIGKKNPKSWWNRDIGEAIAERQKSSREHRQAKKAQLQGYELARKWDIYRGKKSVVQIRVQAKIKGETERWLSEIREKKQAALKYLEVIRQEFWNSATLYSWR